MRAERYNVPGHTFAITSGLGEVLINIPGIIRSGEEKSGSECLPLKDLFRTTATSDLGAMHQSKSSVGAVPG